MRSIESCELRRPKPVSRSNSSVSRSSEMRRVELGPGALFGIAAGARQSRDMLLIGKARHRIVGLRLDRAAHQPPLGMDAENRQRIFAPLRGDAGGEREMLDERSDENRLSRPRKAGDPKPQCPPRQGFREILDREPRIEEKVGERGHGKPLDGQARHLASAWRVTKCSSCPSPRRALRQVSTSKSMTARAGAGK